MAELAEEPRGRGAGGRGAEQPSAIALYLPVGMCLGVAAGLLLDNLAVGIGLGLALGVALGAVVDARRRGRQ
ncbi:hypothetical protein OHB37_07430 [Streptomyces albidoflavus]|uniref:hypothetical protein n=2 Tax=Streptomyces TaxID=1883 RepID=UPI000564BDA8|nr:MULTISPECIES: hypothetical protein [unclassified Streptomyces]MYX83810.1 hypothetical protein [Streptomyces sp. SID4915]WSB14015.1 hypothetical protein OHB37_07430 [Streptomyces albidoflavus]MBT2883758.1 hypothetical protein [Streptomyces sp. McG5]WSD39590.1 hypothetical protein OG919_07535 [Streptomyces albidoflavus]SCD47491.1 hypothetical protein GA0115250_109424 [Streptomyces sp. BvitLS-983]